MNKRNLIPSKTIKLMIIAVFILGVVITLKKIDMIDEIYSNYVICITLGIIVTGFISIKDWE